ncbi:MAG: HNH endonuclease, partial [Butyrivibrio sp.]|nr:HNH endonuclease [Butyrivibrio sp.]
RINTNLMLELMRNTLYTRSIEYSDNRISLFSAQWGRCAITGVSFASVKDIHCHHKTPTSMGGTDKYDNLIPVLAPVHKLIHAKNKDTIEHYLNILNLNKEQLRKVNKLRALAGIEEIL